jgi:hypothetical protein
MPALPASAATPPSPVVATHPAPIVPAIVPADPDGTHVYRYDADAVGTAPAEHLTVIVTRTAPDVAIVTLAPDDGRPGALATDLALVPAATPTPEPRPSDDGGGGGGRHGGFGGGMGGGFPGGMGGGGRGGYGGGRRGGPDNAERRALATLPAPFAAIAAELATNAGPGMSRVWTTDRTVGSGDAAATIHVEITVHGGTFTAAHGTMTRGRSSGGFTVKAL